MIAVRRLKPYCLIGIWLGIFALSVDVALTGLSATPVLRWLPRGVAGTGFFEDNRERVSGAAREYREGRVDTNGRLGAIVGISNVREGIDLGVVSGAIGADWRFLGLGGAGVGIGEVARYADLLVSSELRPEIVVVGFGLHQLVDTRPQPGPMGLGFFGYLRQGNLRSAAGQARNAFWLYTRRQDVSLTVQRSVLDARVWLLDRFGVELAQADDDHRSPWREMVKSEWPEHFSEATLREEEQFFRGMGVFERQTYEQSPKATAAVIDVVNRLREHGAKVLILLMPEHSTLSRQIPQEALALFETRLQAAFVQHSPPVLDFRRALDDENFVDLAHLNSKGGARFSQMLAARIRELLPGPRSLTVNAPSAVFRN